MNKGRANGRKKFNWMGGGLVTRPTDVHVERLSKGKLYGIDLGNAEYQRLGSLTKRDQLYLVTPSSGSNVGAVDARLGITVTDTKVTTDNYATFAAYTPPATSTAANTVAVCYKFTASATRSIAFVKIEVDFTVATNIWKNIKVVFRAAGANPGAVVGQSSNVSVDGYDYSTTGMPVFYFYFPTPVALSSGTDYWLCFQADASGAGQTFETTITEASALFTTNAPTHGIFDYTTNDSSGAVQTAMEVIGDTIYYNNGVSYTSLVTGLAASSAQDLFDFQIMKNILFIADNATTKNLIWDQAQSTTSTHGYRGTFTIGQSASAGGPWSAAGIVKVMLVTELISGGYRASEVKSVTLGATTNKIDLTSIAVDSTAAKFGFDINALATTVYCTLPNGSVYYKVPAVYMSAGGINPIANNDTAESILPMTDAQLIAGGSIESNLQLPTGYFTDQVDTPKAKYLQVFQNFLVMAGDPNNLSSIWISEQYAPQIWSTYGKSYGFRIDVNTDDGEIVTGLGVADGALFVTKQHNVFRVDITGDFNDPLRLRITHGQIGCLAGFTIETIPEGLFFLSERGPAICYGTYTALLPQTALIQNLFDNLNASAFDLNSARYSVACNDVTRNQVIMTVSRGQVDVNGDLVLDSTVRDSCLVYDYEQKLFTLWPQVNLNYVAIVSGSNNFPVMWGGDLSGFIYHRILDPSGSSTPGGGKPYPFYFVSPGLSLEENTYYKEGVFLVVAGNVLTLPSPTSKSYLMVDVFLDGSSTARTTLVYDMTKTNFRNGIPIAVPGKFKTIKLRFRHTGNVETSFLIDWADFTYEIEGVRY